MTRVLSENASRRERGDLPLTLAPRPRRVVQGRSVAAQVLVSAKLTAIAKVPLGGVAILVLLLGAVAGGVEVAVPVRILAAPEPASPEVGMEPSPAGPAGLLSQYRAAGSLGSTNPPNLLKSAKRFVVALPHRWILLEASIEIDGKPFEMIREERIDRLLAALRPHPAEQLGQTHVNPGGLESPPTSNPPQEAGNSESPRARDEPNDEQGAEGNEAGEAESGIELIPRPSASLEARLRRYAAVTGRLPTRDEVRWLLTKWGNGPTLLLLDDNFQRFRAHQAPAFHVLDRDMNGTISATELELAYESLLACDTNQNDVIEYTEIAEVAKDPRRKTLAVPTTALVWASNSTDLSSSLRRLVEKNPTSRRFDQLDPDGDGRWSAAEIEAVNLITPDLTLVISFHSKDPAKSSVRIVHLSPDLAENVHEAMGPWITISTGKTLLELSAVQVAAQPDSDQVSAGLVMDGYPLLPLLDPNEDGRLTIRELRDVEKHLRRHDVNADGQISRDEAAATVRVSFGLGPSVHRHLADIRSAHRARTVPAAVAPDWFTRMDANKDGDISPREFLLGQGRFKELDSDGDGLISPAEAIELAGRQPPPATNSKQDRP